MACVAYCKLTSAYATRNALSGMVVGGAAVRAKVVLPPAPVAEAAVDVASPLSHGPEAAAPIAAIHSPVMPAPPSTPLEFKPPPKAKRESRFLLAKAAPKQPKKNASAPASASA